MDKRHPSSFQQLEKLGEGTYATVGEWEKLLALDSCGLILLCGFCLLALCDRCITDLFRSSKVEIARLENW